MLEITILILSVIVNSILGLAVYIKNPNKDVNRLFFYLTISLSAWLTITHLSIHPALVNQIIWVRFTLAAAAILSYYVLASFAVFPDGNFQKIRFIKPATAYLFFIILFVQTPFVFKSLHHDAAGNVEPVPAPGIALFALLAISFLGGALLILFRKYKRADGQMRDQLRVVMLGVAASFAGILVTNLILASIFKNTSLISFSPLFTLVLTGSMAYAIMKHRLFDLRLAVARAIAYLLTFSLVIVGYSALAYLIGGIFSVGSNSISPSLRFFYIGLAVLTAVVFQPLKKFFDSATSRVFFKDAYEPQLLLDGLSNILVGNIHLETLLSESSKLIAGTIKLVSCNFLIYSPDKTLKAIGTGHTQSELIESLTQQIKAHKGQVIITDELPYSRQHELRNLLTELNCAAIIKLSTHNARVGYLMVGSKKSGDILNALDLRVLGIIADELAIAIENSLRFEEISQFNITLQEKIEAATKQLRDANSRLKELDQTKDEFISMASHQLRTPLTTIKGYLSMVLEGDVGKVNKEQKEMVQHAFDSAQRMVYLIADLLNVSRLQSGKFIIENKPTFLPEVVQGEIDQLKEQSANRNITMNYEAPKEFPTVSLDETKIRQVIMNFLDNALYYTPSGGEVTAELAATASSVSFTVKDTGVGVPASVQHHLFSKFYRADNARKMRPDGTGLGLYMAKKVVVAQGGAIIFKSLEGKGSTFGFSFPRATTEIKK